MSGLLLTPQECPKEYRDATLSAPLKAVPKGWQSLLLLGPAGTGKTSQVWALQRKHVRGTEWAGHHKVHVISECGDIDRYRFDWEHLDAWSQFRGVLCVDDVGYRKIPSEWALQAVYYLATYRRAHGLRVVWTTNLDRNRLAEAYGAPIQSRLCGGVVLVTGGADRRQKGQG